MGMTRSMRRKMQREAFNQLCRITLPTTLPPDKEPWWRRLLEWLQAKFNTY